LRGNAGLLRLMAANPGLVVETSCSCNQARWAWREQMMESKAYLSWMSIVPGSGFLFGVPNVG
jgi:hypothetical protein